MTRVGTIDRVGDFDALATAKPGEPLFPLKGGDPFAPRCVLLWAVLAREHALKMPEGEERAHLLAKATSAENAAWEMQDYRLGVIDIAVESGNKDEIAAVASYNGIDPDETRLLARCLGTVADRIYNAVAELNDQADAILALGQHPDAEAKLRDAIIAASEGARIFEPRRHLQRSAG